MVATCGALLNSPAWMRIITDAIDRPVAASAVEENSSCGAALLALERSGGPDPAEAGFLIEEVYEPDPEAHESYRAALERRQEPYVSVVMGAHSHDANDVP